MKLEITQYEREGGWFINGFTEGHLAGKRDALLRIIEGRRFALTEEQRKVIDECTDEAQLDCWLVRALDVGTAQALLAG